MLSPSTLLVLAFPFVSHLRYGSTSLNFFSQAAVLDGRLSVVHGPAGSNPVSSICGLWLVAGALCVWYTDQMRTLAMSPYRRLPLMWYLSFVLAFFFSTLAACFYSRIVESKTFHGSEVSCCTPWPHIQAQDNLAKTMKNRDHPKRCPYSSSL